MTNREKEILNIIEKNPYISQNEISKILNIKRSSVAVHILNLTNKGYLLGRGYIINKNISNRVCVIGGCNIDFIARSYDKINMYDSNPGYLQYSFGGVAKNISENLIRLGINNSFITAIGDDNYSKELKSYLTNLKIDYSNSKFLNNSNMSQYISILDENNDLFTAISSMEVMKEVDIDFISKKIEYLKTFEYIVMDTNLNEDVLEFICKNCTNSKIIIDCVSRKKSLKIKNILEYIHFIKPNIYEAEELSDIKYVNNDTLIKMGEYFINKGMNKIFISLGKDGIFYYEKNNYGIVKLDGKINVINTSGCGDSSISGMIYGDIKELSNEEIAKLGISAGSITAQCNETVSNEINEKNLLNFGGKNGIKKIFGN